jgi:hypothetical protein
MVAKPWFRWSCALLLITVFGTGADVACTPGPLFEFLFGNFFASTFPIPNVPDANVPDANVPDANIPDANVPPPPPPPPPAQQVAAPTFDPTSSTFTASLNVIIASTTAGATVRYTADGSDPTSTSGTIYTGPVPLSATTTLKAIAYAAGMTDSTVSSATYTLQAPPPPPPPPPTGNAATGQTIWSQRCAFCHGAGTYMHNRGSLLVTDLGTLSPVMSGMTLTSQEVLDLQAFAATQ